MRAAILAVGSELLGPHRLDTNSLFFTAALRRFGVATGYKAIVGDDEAEIAAEVRRLVRRFELVILTGGLGPTEDDRSREAVASALGRGIARRSDLVEELRRRFASFGIEEMPRVNEKQADVIDGATVLSNRRGTAPGQRIEHGESVLFLFPGVPIEAQGMVESYLEPWLAQHAGEAVTETRVMKLACLPESQVEADLETFYADFGNDGFSVLPSPGEVTLQLTATGSPREREPWLAARQERLRRLFGKVLYTESDSASLETVVGECLRSAAATVVTAESCTGGLISQRLTRVAGSSDYFLGGVISYSNEIKSTLLGVDRKCLEQYGAVSREVVTAMAGAARQLLGGDWAIAVSGVAGPGGGSEDKPVGTVHLAVDHEDGTSHRQLRLPGDRERVRWLASQWALDLLRLRLLDRVS